MPVTDFFRDSKSWKQLKENHEMPVEYHGRITEKVEYDIIDTYGHRIIKTFGTEENADEFLVANPKYMRPGVKIIPTLTFRDIGSLNHIMSCMSKIYDTDKKNWFDNKIVDEIVREFIDKIDVIRSDMSVKGYVQ